MEHGIINDMAICIISAWLLGVAAHLIKQPLIIAYLGAGFLVGPLGMGLVNEAESVETISQLGLILLLFMIGLEINLKKVLTSGRLILYTAAAQIFGCCLLVLLFFLVVKIPGAGKLDPLYLGVAGALSSTIVIIKILYDRRELDTLPGRITLGLLVLQDLFAILFLAFQPNLHDPSILYLLQSMGKVVLLVVVTFIASRYLLPTLFKSVARLPELILVGALAWCFLIAGLAASLGLSKEMGALVAGVALSTFPYTLDVTARITTLRDFFVTLFFVALGMSIPSPTFAIIGWSLVLALLVVTSRFLTILPVLHWMKQGHRVSLLPSLQLSQLSEFSLVILALGEKSNHISTTTVGIASYAFVLLAILSTYGMLESDRLWRKGSELLTKMGIKDLQNPRPSGSGDPQTQGRIYLLGFSWTASSFLHELNRRSPTLLKDLVVVDFNPNVFEELKKRGLQVIYGDISHRDTLIHAGIPQAEIIFCTLPNTVLKGTSNLRMLQQLREVNSEAQIIVHAEQLGDIPKLYEAGASYVISTRILESNHLIGILTAAQDNELDLRRTALDETLQSRAEVIP